MDVELLEADPFGENLSRKTQPEPSTLGQLIVKILSRRPRPSGGLRQQKAAGPSRAQGETH